MKNRTLPLVVVMLLSLSAPLLAQSEYEPQPAAPQVDEPVESDIQATDESAELPRTAGPLPLLALLGVASGASALALRKYRR